MWVEVGYTVVLNYVWGGTEKSNGGVVNIK